jgi:hypothetical protein
MKSFKPPQRPDISQVTTSLFLAGAIDQGRAIPWQKRIEDALEDRKVTVLNPRRDDWDATWDQSPDHPSFADQVKWELDYLETAETIVFYFPADSEAPITLLELGLYGTPQKAIVFCPKEYWRSGNVHIVCKRKGIPVYTDHDEFVEAVCSVFPKL